MTLRLDLNPRHREQIERLLREHVPGIEVWAYGSRVDGRSHEGSDLDLVLRGADLRPIPFDALQGLEEAFRDSSLPFLVEVRDWARLPEAFHREIERGYMALTGAAREISARPAARRFSDRRRPHNPAVVGASAYAAYSRRLGRNLPGDQGDAEAAHVPAATGLAVDPSRRAARRIEA